MPDVYARIARARARAGKLRNIWQAELPIQLKLRLYKSAVCSILTYGSEAWRLDERACKAINAANAKMLAFITGKSIAEEAMVATTTFNLLMWIRCRRLQWCGHILRMHDERLVKRALHHIYQNRQLGDLLMDVPAGSSWAELQEMATSNDKCDWKGKVQRLKAKVQRQGAKERVSCTAETLCVAEASMRAPAPSKHHYPNTRSRARCSSHVNEHAHMPHAHSTPTRPKSNTDRQTHAHNYVKRDKFAMLMSKQSTTPNPTGSPLITDDWSPQILWDISITVYKKESNRYWTEPLCNLHTCIHYMNIILFGLPIGIRH